MRTARRVAEPGLPGARNTAAAAECDEFPLEDFGKVEIEGLERGASISSQRPLPVPGGPDDFLQVGVARLPAEEGGGLGARAHEGGRVAGPPGLREQASLDARDLLGGGDDLPDGEAVSISEIVVIRSPALDEAQEAEPVRLGEIVHVDIVADAGTVGRGVVGPEDGDLRPLPARLLSTRGIRWVSGSWFSPISPSGSQPAALK